MHFQIWKYLIFLEVFFVAWLSFCKTNPHNEISTESATDWKSEMICEKHIFFDGYYSVCVNNYTSLSYKDYISKCGVGSVIIDSEALNALTSTFLPFWLPFKREKSTLPYESNAINSFTLARDSYLNNIAEKLFDNTNCLIRDGEKTVPVNCDEYYSAVCIYKITNANGEGVKNCKVIGQNAFYKNSHECYSLDSDIYKNIHMGNRFDYCENEILAEPYNEEEFLEFLELMNKIQINETYHIGIEYNDVNKSFYLPISKTLVQYPKRYNPEIYGKFGMIHTDNNMEQYLTFSDKPEANGAVCQTNMPMEKEPLKITLKASPAIQNISILVENMQNAFDLTIYCYEGDEFRLNVQVGERTPEKKSQLKNLKKVYFYYPIHEYPKFYQCEAIDLYGNIIRSNTLYTYSNLNIRIYNVVINTTIAAYAYPVSLIPNIAEKLLANSFISKSIYPKEVLKYVTGSGYLEVLYQFATNNNAKNDTEDFKYVTLLFDKINSGNLRIVDLYNKFYCSESISHDPHTGETLHWPMIRIKTETASNELCIDEDRVPVRRRCEIGKNDKPTWSEVSGKCKYHPKDFENTKKLDNLLHSNETAAEIMKNISSISFTNDVIVTDVYLLASIFDKIVVEENETILEDVLKTLNNVINFNRTVLKLSQYYLNSTDVILDVFDKILNYMPKNKIIEENFTSIEAIVIGVTNFSHVFGFGLNRKYELVKIYDSEVNGVTKRVESGELWVAAFFGDHTRNVISTKNLNCIVTFFINDTLFNQDPSAKNKSNLPVVDVLIPGYQEFFKDPLSILYYTENNSSSCGYWEYGLDDFHNSIKGSWNVQKEHSEYYWRNNVLICNYSHLTHFGMIISDSKDSGKDEEILSIITIVGCSFSFGGVLMILAVAFISQKWRNEKSTILFFNFIFAIILTYILFFVSSFVESGVACKIIGMLLHYSVISQFAWTLILSYFQYNKFVVVFNLLPSNAIRKSAIFAWIFPILPVAITALINVNFYHKVPSGLCYLNALKLKLAVLLPIALILTTNFLILVRIVFSLTCNRKSKVVKKEWKRIMKSVGVMSLFLGFNWFLGIALAFNDQNLILSYLFSLSSTMQGFVICVTYLFTSTSKVSLKKMLSRNSFTSSTKYTSTEAEY